MAGEGADAWSLPGGGDLSTDDDTGKRTIRLGVDLGSHYRVPDGDTYDAPLSSLVIIPVDDDSFQMQLQVTPEQGDGITIGNIGNTENEEKIQNFPGMRAWRAFLVDIVESGSIDDDAVWGYDFDTDFGNRNYLWEQESGSRVRFQLQGLTLCPLASMGPGISAR